MEFAVASMFKLYKLSPGRAFFGLEGTVKVADKLGYPDLAKVAAREAERIQAYIQLVSRADASGTGNYSDETKETNRLLIEVLGGLLGYLDSQTRIHTGTERAASAVKVRTIAFPNGIGGITNLSFAEQNTQITALVERVEHKDLAADVARLPEVPPTVDRVVAINDEFGVFLHTGKDIPTRTELANGRAQVQESVCQVVCAIIGHFVMQGSDPNNECALLLEPLMQQNEAMRIAHRRRRAGSDNDSDVDAAPDDSDADRDGDGEAPEPGDGRDGEAPEPGDDIGDDGDDGDDTVDTAALSA